MRLAAAILLVSAPAFADPPTIKPSEVAAKTAAALAGPFDAKTPKGQGTELFSIEKANLDVDGKALRAELPKQGLTILEERPAEGSIAFTVEAKSGARATIGLGIERGRVVATLRPTTSKPPGTCTPIPDIKHHVIVTSRGINDRGDSFEGSTRWYLDTGRLLDVDGDGILDAFVPVVPNANACPEEVSYRVFVVRGNCGHEIGTVGPGSMPYDAETVPLAASGYRPITMGAQKAAYGQKDGIPEMTHTTRRFEVAASAGGGSRYKQVDIKSSTGVCHHCGVWHCNKE